MTTSPSTEHGAEATTEWRVVHLADSAGAFTSRVPLCEADARQVIEACDDPSCCLESRVVTREPWARRPRPSATPPGWRPRGWAGGACRHCGELIIKPQGGAWYHWDTALRQCGPDMITDAEPEHAP